MSTKFEIGDWVVLDENPGICAEWRIYDWPAQVIKYSQNASGSRTFVLDNNHTFAGFRIKLHSKGTLSAAEYITPIKDPMEQILNEINNRLKNIEELLGVVEHED